MSRKRKIEELGEHIVSAAVGEHIVSAAVGDVVSRTISSAVGKLEERADVESQVERLDTLVMMVRSAVEAADGVHIRNLSLRRWLWKLREAACEGADAVRSFRQRAAAEERIDAGSGTSWWARLLRTAKSLFVGRGGGAAAVRSAVPRLEKVVSGLGDFLKLLEMESRRVPLHPPPPSLAPTDPDTVLWDLPRDISDGEDLTVPVTDTSREMYYLAAASDDGDVVRDHSCGRAMPVLKWPTARKRKVNKATGVIRFAVGAGLIWFAVQIGTQLFGGPRARYSEVGRKLSSPFRHADCIDYTSSKRK